MDTDSLFIRSDTVDVSLNESEKSLHFHVNRVHPSFFDQSKIVVKDNSQKINVVVLLSGKETHFENEKYKTQTLRLAKQFQSENGVKRKEKTNWKDGLTKRLCGDLTKFEKSKVKKSPYIIKSGYKVKLQRDIPVLYCRGKKVCPFCDIPQQRDVYYWVPFYVKKSKELCLRPDVFCIHPKTGLMINKIRPKHKKTKHDIHVVITINVSRR